MTPRSPALCILRRLGRLRWIPFGIRDRIIRRFVNPDRIPPTPYSADFAGLTYTGDLSRFIDWEIFFYGGYEPEILSLLDDIWDKSGDEDVCFLDIGANIGQHSLFAARRGIRVIAFEPWAKARAQLEIQIAGNGLTNIEIRPYALGTEDAERDFYAPTGSNTGTGSLSPDYNPDNNTEVLKVTQRRGDDVLSGDDFHGPVVIKIDVEGAEREVLEGLTGFMRDVRPTVIMELSAETRRSFGDCATFEAVFAPGSEFATILRQHDRYALAGFDFDQPHGNILITPPKPGSG
jgi:FkbM family methyltransferase